MIKSFLTLNALQIGGMGLGYLTIAYLARWQGLDVLGEYLFHLNSVIILGTLASMGLPTIVQRLGAQLNGTQIQIATWIMVRRQWLNMIGIAGVGSFTILMLNKDQRLTLFSGGQLGLSAFSFALFLVLLETIRISRGTLLSETLRNVARPVLLLVLLLSSVDIGWAVLASILGTLSIALAGYSRLPPGQFSMDPRDRVKLEDYVANRGRDMRTLVLLNVTGLVVSSIDIILFGLLYDQAETGAYGAASRFAMLINVALLAGNAQMVLQVARVADKGKDDVVSVEQLRKQVKLVRIMATSLLAALCATLPLYAWALSIPFAKLWPYFLIVALSSWLQAMFGPSNMLLVQTHQTMRLIAYNGVGILVFLFVAFALHRGGFVWAVPMGAAVAANLVKMLSWRRFGHYHGIYI